MMKLCDVSLDLRRPLWNEKGPGERFSLSGKSLDKKTRYHVWVTLPDLAPKADDAFVHMNAGTKYRKVGLDSKLGRAVFEALLWHDRVLLQAQVAERMTKARAEKVAAQNVLIYIARAVRDQRLPADAELRRRAGEALRCLGH